jgi:hypothetical protein
MFEVPDRVFEYGDVEMRRSGLKYVSAAILFHPERLPAWASDFRVAATNRTVFVPDDVRFVTFRDDRDGWRPTPTPSSLCAAGRTSRLATDAGSLIDSPSTKCARLIQAIVSTFDPM